MSSQVPVSGRSSQLGTVLQIIAVVGAAVLTLWTLHRIASVVLVLIAGALFAYVMEPMVQVAGHPIRLGGRDRRLPRAAAVGVVYLLVAVVICAGAMLLLPIASRQAAEAVARFPAYAQSVLEWEHGWSRYYERLRLPLELRRWIDESASATVGAAMASVRQWLRAAAGSVSLLPWLVLVPVLAFFLLKDAGDIRRIIVTALPFRFRLRSHKLFEALNAALAAYVRAQLLACALVGTVCWVGFAVIGLPYAVLLGVLAGVLEFIPLVGPFLLAAVAAGVGALHATAMALWVIGFLAIFRVVEDYVIYPRLIRRGLELHPLAVIVGVLAGAELGGVAGMFLAVPAVAVATIVCRHGLMWSGSKATAPATVQTETVDATPFLRWSVLPATDDRGGEGEGSVR